MIKLKQGIGLVAVGSLAFLAGRMIPASDSALAAQPDKKAPAAAQPDKKPAAPAAQPDKKPAQPDKKPDAGAMPEMPKPGAEHKKLDVFIGDFEGSVTFWMGPDAKPESQTGSIHREWILNGWFVSEDVTGGPMGPPGSPNFNGMAVMGFNQYDKKYQTGWIDNSDSPLLTTMGTYDEKTKVFTFAGDGYEQMTKKKAKVRSTIDVSNPDKEVMVSFCTPEGGKEYKCFEGTFTRKKGGAPK